LQTASLKLSTQFGAFSSASDLPCFPAPIWPLQLDGESSGNAHEITTALVIFVLKSLFIVGTSCSNVLF
jgi:hypothetical protein